MMVSDIKAIVQSGSYSVAVFKKKEDAYTFENYLTATGVLFLSPNSNIRVLSQFGNFLSEQRPALESEGYLYIFARYVPTQIIEDFIKIMED